MIGKYPLEIGQKSDGTNDFLKGMATSAASPDGGFSPESGAVNITAQQGVLYAPATLTNKSTNLTGDILASSVDGSGTNNRYFLADNGTYYSFDGSSLTLITTDSTNTYSSGFGTIDFVYYNGNFYNTTNNSASGDIVRFDGFTATPTWWTVTKGKTALTGACRHPMVEFNRTLFIANKNVLASWDEPNNIATNAVLTLEANQAITALGIDPGSGLMLVAVASGSNYSSTKPTAAFLGLYDGFNPTQFRKKIPVDGLITGIYNVGGTVYVAYGNKLGYFTGTGIKFLRRFNFTVGAGANLAYKHHFANIDNTLYVIDKTKILAFAEIEGGKGPVFSYATSNTINSNNFNCVCDVGSGVLGVAFGTNKFYTFDTTSVATTDGVTFYSKRVNFPRPVFLRTLFVEYDVQLTNTQAPGTASIIDSNGTTTALTALTSSGTQGVLTTTCRDIKTRSVQLKYAGSTVATGVRRFTIMYDIAE